MMIAGRRKNWFFSQIRKWQCYMLRRIIHYRQMNDEMDALRREIEECDKP